MKAPARHGLMAMIVTLSSLPLVAAASAPSGADGRANGTETQVKPKKSTGARPAPTVTCPDQNLVWHLHHI
jgi:hypothetical protein